MFCPPTATSANRCIYMQGLAGDDVAVFVCDDLSVTPDLKDPRQLVAVGFFDMDADAFSRDGLKIVATQPLMVAIHAAQFLPFLAVCGFILN